jgi:hypothetical protein
MPSPGIWLWGAGFALLALLALTSEFRITPVQLICTLFMLALSVRAYQAWAARTDTKIPVWAMICGTHLLVYGVALFEASRVSPSQFDRGSVFTDSTLDSAMFLGLVSLVAIGLGRNGAATLSAHFPLRLRLLNIERHTPVRIQVLLAAGIVANVFGTPLYGSSLWNVSVTMFGVLPMAAFLCIVLRSTGNKVGEADVLLAGVFFVTRLVSGAKFGASLGTIIWPMLLVGLALVSVNRRLPWRAVATVACLILFLQPSKVAVRRELGEGALSGSAPDVIIDWCKRAASDWGDVLTGQAPVSSLVSAAASRASVLSMASLVLDKTPDLVPFQYGRLYPLLIKNLIPRIFWPDKPTVGVANQFFQVEYGLTDRENLGGVSIACGFEAEGYMNLGWFGVIVVGLFVGLAIGYYERSFFHPTCSLATSAIGLALLPGCLVLESQLVQYLGGVLQTLAAAMIVFHSSDRKGQNV